MKRVISLLLTVALIVGLVPVSFTERATAASEGSYFLFTNQQYDINSPKIVNTDRVSFSGTIANVLGNTVNYSVEQIKVDSSGKVTVVNSSKGQIGGLTVNGSTITVTNLQLYAGLNRVTFSGSKGGNTTVSDTIYFDYRNNPTLYNLKAVMSGQSVDLTESQPATIVATSSSPFYMKDSADITITGYAPGAEEVTVEVNGVGNSFTYPVNSYDKYSFYAAPFNVKSGKNVIKIKAVNNDQMVETTRELTFYNGKITFYDVTLTDGSKTSADLATFPDFASTATNGLTVNGKVMIPYDPANPQDPAAYYIFNGGAKTSITSINKTISGNFMLADYSFQLPGPITPDVKNSLSFMLDNQAASQTFGFTLRDPSKSYIYQVNYLSGYSEGMSSTEVANLSGDSLDGANIYSLPAAVEVLIANGNVNDSVKINGTPADMLVVPNQLIVKDVNGASVTMVRAILKISALPKSGSQTITFETSSGNVKSVTATLLFGPDVKFNKLYTGLVMYLDASDTNRKQTVLTELDKLRGQILNVPESEIKYSGSGRSVFLYVNNTLIDLQQDSSTTKFVVTGDAENTLYNAIFPGENTVKFEFNGSSKYTKTYKFSYIPKDSPSIPAASSDSVYPFTFVNLNDNLPLGQDSNFTSNGSVFLTKQKKMNVYGTFDFIKDLGTNKTDVENSINSLIVSANTSEQKQAILSNYVVRITSPSADGKDIVNEWNLGNEFSLVENNVPVSGGTISMVGPASTSSPLSVYYDVDKQYFRFILRDQSLPEDGSPIVYNISVYNTGKGGAVATYRLEVNPVTEPFNIVRPLPQKRVVNQNFVEVVVYSPNATSVVINKQQAEKTSFQDYTTGGIVGYDPAYRAIVKNLKPNKDTVINVTVTVGTTTTTQTITVRYVPTNIPGAQFMQTMASNSKVFNGELSLAFPKGTSLIRRDYDEAASYRGQVFANHDLLFAIANRTDGIVDRHDFEQVPAGYDVDVVGPGKIMFQSTFDTHFIKSSSVFWIDPGLADNINTSEYDPVTYGSDPYQFRVPEVKHFFDRDPLRELVPSKRGTLTLTYDPNLSEDAGRLVTVFHYNPELRQWENVGGVVNAKKHTITVSFDRFGYYVVGKLSYSYKDVNQHPYARDYVETLYAKGIMKPIDPANQFGVDSSYVSRGEFTSMIVRAKDLPLNYLGTQHFVDISNDITSVKSTDLWDFRYIETAARAGITRGTQPTVFEPTSSITRQDSAVMIAKALNLKMQTNRAQIIKGLQKYYKDYASIDYYAQPAVLAVAQKGFMTGSPVDVNDPKQGYMFNPNAVMLRGDAAVLMGKVMISLKKLPNIQ
ncbi:S-layer homology domain-containing protein [Paenibacillus caui]|uniref:S-layer homology domain-containing protein n=1 Tax=Paenibacillus caui TaxID=2873927 RepID=UPI001CA9FFA9|nr:S-layer homology domain-containing protein [Paenibacillus caui]